jgi:hypothetical protein
MGVIERTVYVCDEHGEHGPDLLASVEGVRCRQCERVMRRVRLVPADQLAGAVATLTSVRVWAEIVRDHNSDEHIRRHMRMLLGLLDGEDPDTFGQS